ncbi:MAG: peptide ABC transporter substrate-binding protein [Oscillospiraceae bacterium]|nr:peptide ABC transporter substrate-binding protein [Oscillospiraceae bacterium]
MEKRLRLICNFLIIILIITITSGCKKGEADGSDYIFVYDLPDNPGTLDPQTAVDEYARLVIANLFEGLLRMDSGGDITAGAAMEYEISDDSLTYTFYLRDDIFWTDRSGFNAQCTAHDFVFAFRRLFNPQVKSRNAPEYYSILNSRKIHEGEAERDLLGVYADGDFKLTIQLETPDVNFPVLLTSSPSFPCNEVFYEQSAGRYGLIADAVPSNGGFYLKEWVYDPHWTYENKITLRRNNHNSKSEKVYPAGVDFLMDRGERIANFTSGKSDCIIISGDSANMDGSYERKNFPYTRTENSVWGLSFNKNGALSKKNLRLALAYATDRETVDINRGYYWKTSEIIPDGIKIGGVFFRELIGSPEMIQADSETATSYYNGAFMIEPPVLIIPFTSENNGIDTFVRSITQQWQEKLSLFCRIEVLPAHEYRERLSDGSYDIAVEKIIPAYNSPLAILEKFSEGNEKSAEFLQKARQSDSHKEAARHFLSAEGEVLKSAEFLPICFVAEYFFMSKKSEGIVYNPFSGAILFRNAKMY